jgi:hypothetical protein
MADPHALPFAVKDFQPASFAERGAHVPFTSPMLAHARLRIGPRGARELVIRNQGSGEGFYVGAWHRMIDSARLSVHDRLLYRRIEAANATLPLEIRRVAREVALEGYAGRPARAAAAAALDAEAAVAARIRDRLLAGCPAPPAGAAASRLEELAGALTPLGLDDDTDTPLMRDLAALRALSVGLDAGAHDQPPHDAPLIDAIQSAADLVIRLVAEARGAALAGTGQPMALLETPGAVGRCAAQVGRVAWLLDGWAALAAAWDAAAAAGQPAARRALAEIAANLPELPRELATQRPVPPSAPATPPRRVRAGQDWLSGIAERDLVARNEAMLARVL